MTEYRLGTNNLPKPAWFDEWFTIGRDPVGEPIQRRLREMTADDVLASLDWYLQEQQRLLSGDTVNELTMPLLHHAVMSSLGAVMSSFRACRIMSD
jgi:hypothetical protein